MAIISQNSHSFSLYNSELVISVFIKPRQRSFSTGKKKKGGKKGAGQQSDTETETTTAEHAAEEDKFAAARQSTHEETHVDQSLFKPFSLGDVKKIQSTPDHQVTIKLIMVKATI
jgi:hypothetical protein